MKKYNVYLLLALSCLLYGCTHLILGKDNSERPAELTSIEAPRAVKKLWTTNTGKGTQKKYLKLLPAYYGDMIYTADSTGLITAIHGKNGEKQWQVSIKMPVTSGPTVGYGRILLGTGDAKVVALDMATGKVLWEASVPSEVLATPTQSVSRVFVKTLDGKLTALDTSNGHKLWIYQHRSPELVLRASSSPQIYKDSLVVGFDDGSLQILRMKNAKMLWQTSIAAPVGPTPIDRIVDINADPLIMDDILYVVSYQGNLMAIDLRNGRELWRRPFSSYTGMTADQRHLFIVDDHSHVWSFDKRTGRVMWKQQKLQARGLTAPTQMGEELVLGDAKGYLHWLEKSDGDIVARVDVGHSAIIAPPTVVGNKLFVQTERGKLVAYERG